MNKDLLQSFRDVYFKKIAERKQKSAEIETLLRRQKILENTLIVQNYIELLQTIEKAMLEMESEEQIFLHTMFDFQKKGLFDSTNNILLYDGTFINDQDYVIMVERDYPNAEFDKYIDIESSEELYIPVEDRESFEGSHKVVF